MTYPNKAYRSRGLTLLFECAEGCFVSGLVVIGVGIGTSATILALVVGSVLVVLGLVLDIALTRWEEKQDSKAK